jgi:outer membrane immunogenic protein
MKRFLAAVLLTAASVTPAIADGPARRGSSYDYGRPAISWAGYHVGIQGGASFWSSEHLFTGGVASGDFDFSSGFIGAGWGSTWQRGALVYGFDSDISFAGTGGSRSSLSCGVGACFTDVHYFGTSRVRLGYAMDRMLVYATGGLAYASVKAGNATDQDSKTRYGWALGAGIEWMLRPGWSAKVEYQHLDLGDGRTYSTGGSGAGVDLSADIVRAGINYRFDLPFLRWH